KTNTFTFVLPEHRSLHSYPTRRSSDLLPAQPGDSRIGLEQGRGRSAAQRDKHFRRDEFNLPIEERQAYGDLLRRRRAVARRPPRSEEHTSELQSREKLVYRLLRGKNKY